MDLVSVRWNRNRQFVGWNEAGQSLVMDSPADYRGEGSGIRPVELVLYAIAGCTGMDVISILEKKRQDVRGIEIHARGTRREDDYPKIYTQIELEYVVTGFGVSEEAVRRSIQLSEEKYCAVGWMLGDDVRVSTSFRVIEAEQPAVQEG